MIHSWKVFSEKIEREIKANPITGEPKELYNPIDYTLQLGGKRIRPVLCLLAAQLFAGSEEKALKAAMGIEIFHNFTLVHDDIMDEAPLRRGNPSVHKKWNRDIAILSGDVMMVKAYEKLLESDVKNISQVLQLFNQTAIEVCEGQQLDMNFEERNDVSLKEYLKMIELKTAVLLACSLKVGALVSGAKEKDANLLYEFGRNLGIAFQIQDDYLDAYADPDKFGKRVGGDIISNKKTYLLLSALEHSSSAQREEINHLLSKEFSDEEKVSKMLDLYNEIDIPQKSREKMNSFYELGMSALSEIDTKQELKAPLIDLANALMERNT